MRALPVPDPGSSHYVWRLADKPVAIHLSMDVVSRMQPLLSLASGERTVEVGGFLLGQVRQVNDSWIVSIDDFETADCEYARGASWTLSSRDRQNFGRRLARLNRRGPVGWFRTHTRPGLFLDQSDFRLFSEFFPNPASVALAIRPQPDGAEAGFFFWEDGDVHRSASYRTFRFDPEALRSAVPAAPAPAAIRTPDRNRAPADVPPKSKTSRPVPAVTPATDQPVQKTAAAPPPRASLPSKTPARTKSPARTKWNARKLAYAAPIAAGILAGFLWQPTVLRNSRSRAAQPAVATSAGSVTERTVFAPPPEAAAQPDVATALSPELRPEPVPRHAAPSHQTARPVRKLTISSVTAPRALPEPKIDDGPPEIAMSVRTEQAPVPPPAQPRITTTVEPVRVSGLRRAVGSIPGLGFLKRRKNAEAFVPPKPIQRIEPTSLALQREDEPVRVKVTVNPVGEVASAQVLSRNVEPDAARAAIEAARKWRFAPATIDDKPVSAELILSFAATGARGM